MMPQHPLPRLAVVGRDELPAAVAYLLGYHPTPGSLAGLAVADRRVATAVGIDAHRLPGDADAVGEAARQLAQLAVQHGWELMLIAYGTPTQAAQLVRAVFAALAERHVTVIDAVRVDGNRLYCLLCDDCPAAGITFDITTSRFSAAATYAGLVAAPDRAAIAQRYAPLDGARRAQMNLAIARAVTGCAALVGNHSALGPQPLQPATAAALREAGIAAVNDALREASAGAELSDDDAAWLTVLLHHLPVRDHALMHGTDAGHLPLWAELTRRAPEHLAAPPACLLAICALLTGDGITANIAIDRARTADPHYTLAHLLIGITRRGMPPHELRRVLHQATADFAADPAN